MSSTNPYSQINNSPAKAMYSFGKSSRPSMANKVYCDTFYNVPQTKSQRKASIGYGKKVDWDELNKSKKQIPPPGTYATDDFATMNKSHHKGFTVGIGRQETKNQSFIQFDESVPGPQKYHVQLQNEGPKYSLRPRTASQTFVKNSSKIIPGPGRYDTVNSLNPEGKYCISKWSSSRAKRFNPKTSARFMQTKSQAPGVGKYTPRNSFWLDNEHITESKYMSTGNRVFGTGNRSTIFEDEPKKHKNMPGPGMYESFSDFGSMKELPGRNKNWKRQLHSTKPYKMG